MYFTSSKADNEKNTKNNDSDIKVTLSYIPESDLVTIV